MSLFLHPPKLAMVTRLLLKCFVLLIFSYSSFADYPSFPSSMATPSKFCTTNALNVSASAG